MINQKFVKMASTEYLVPELRKFAKSGMKKSYELIAPADAFISKEARMLLDDLAVQNEKIMSYAYYHKNPKNRVLAEDLVNYSRSEMKKAVPIRKDILKKLKEKGFTSDQIKFELEKIKLADDYASKFAYESSPNEMRILDDTIAMPEEYIPEGSYMFNLFGDAMGRIENLTGMLKTSFVEALGKYKLG